MNRYEIIIFLALIQFTNLSFCQSIELDKDLVVKLEFNGDANDLSGNNIPVDVIGPVLTADRKDNPFQAYLFNGVDDRIVLNSNQPVITSGSFSICAWAKMNGQSFSENQQNVLFEQRDDNALLETARSTILFQAQNVEEQISFGLRGNEGTYPYYVTYPAENYNEWHHYAAVVEGNTVRLYLDGVLKETGEYTANKDFTVSVDHVDIGTHQYSGAIKGAFYGSIDDVLIYNRALNDCEIYYICYDELPDER